eukprot:285331_1
MNNSNNRSIKVQLRECTVIRTGKKAYTRYTFEFIIRKDRHKFTSRYSKLHALHQSMKKEINELPKFPSKDIFTNYTKQKNYQKRAKELLIYFQSLILNPLVLKNELFINSIHLTHYFKQLIRLIANNKVYTNSEYYLVIHYWMRNMFGSQSILPSELINIIDKYCESNIKFDMYRAEDVKVNQFNDNHYSIETDYNMYFACMVSSSYPWHEKGKYSFAVKIIKCGAYNFFGIFAGKNDIPKRIKNIHCSNIEFERIYFFTSNHNKIRHRKKSNICGDWKCEAHTYGTGDIIEVCLSISQTYNELIVSKNGKRLCREKILVETGVYYPFVAMINEHNSSYVYEIATSCKEFYMQK